MGDELLDDDAADAAATDDETSPLHIPHPDYEHKTENNFDAFWHRTKRGDTSFGWKLHLSLHPKMENILPAWQHVIFPILTRYEIGEFKIARPEQWVIAKGKIITIYLAYNPEFRIDSAEGNTRLQDMLQEIENGLLENKIRPGVKPKIDEGVTGSRFFSCRCELGAIVEDDHRPDGEEPFYKLISDEKEAIYAASESSTSTSNPYKHPDNYGLSAIRTTGTLAKKHSVTKRLTTI